MQQLKSKAINGLKWTTINTLINALSAPIYQVLLARYLTPKEFAYIAAISLITTLGTLVLDIGYGEAMVQKKEITDEQISSLVIFNFFVSLVGSLVFFIVIKLVENIYSLEKLSEYAILIISFIFLSTLIIVYRAYLQKMMLFKQYSIFQIIKNISDISFSMLFIVNGFSVLGYLIGSVISSIIFAFIMIYYVNKKTKFVFSFKFKFNYVKDLLNFSIMIYLKNLLTFVTKRIDELIIGSMFSSSTLGVYYFGKRLILQVQSIISNSFSQLLLPIFSKLNDKSNLENVKRVYFKITLYSSSIAIPLFTGLSLTAEKYMPIIFGDKWNGSIIVIEFLSIAMIFQVLTANIATSLLYSQNKVKIVLLIDLFTTLIYLILLFILGNGGLESILFLFTGYTILKTMMLQNEVGKSLNYTFVDYFKVIRGVIASIILMVLNIYMLQKINFSNDIYELLTIVLSSVTIYFCSFLITNKTLLKTIKLKRF